MSEPKATTISTKLFTGFAPSASNSTDSGKFSSDNATGRLDAELAKTPQSEKPFAGFSSTKPLFTQSSTTTVTSLPSSTMPPFIPSVQTFQKQQPEPSKSTASVHKLPTRLTPSAPITAVFKPPKVADAPETPKPALPVAVRWLRLQRDYYRKFVANVKEFIENPENNELRRIIKMEVGNSVDKALQKRPTDVELTKSLAEFLEYLNRFLSGETMSSTLMPNKTFTFEPKSLNFLIHTLSVRIIVSLILKILSIIYAVLFCRKMVKQDPSLTDVAKLVHSVIASKLTTFKKIFRQILTNSMFLIQLTSDDLVVTLDEKLTADAGYFTLHCLDSDKSLFRLLCIIEMTENPQVKNLSDLCGIRLLYELSVACNSLPQIPVTTLSVLFEIMQTAGPALTAESSPYRKDFLQIVFPRLRALVEEDVSSAIDGITVRLAEQSFATHLTKMHSIVRQRVLDALEKIGIIKC
uniref:Uncharacterized protein n=1 Tax=Panagrolaimus superbus TaxID=310955 RepID=A0A914YUM8_9BILA